MPDRTVEVVVCADAGYALPMAVTLQSLDRSADRGVRVRVHALHSGITPEVQGRVTSGLSTVEVVWYAVEESHLGGAHFPSWLSPATLYRLLLGELLPASVTKVLYLDCDLVVSDDLTELFEHDLDGHSIGAVRDANNPWAARHAFPFWRVAGLEPGAPYFNAGVLLIDLARWRTESVGRRCLDLLSKHRLPFADQDALNAVLAGKWLEVPRRWNVQTNETLDGYGWFLDSDDTSAALAAPAVVHFTEQPKPWHESSTHTFRDLWFAAADHTAWAGWRPRPRRLRSLAKAGSRAARALRQRLTPSTLPQA